MVLSLFISLSVSFAQPEMPADNQLIQEIESVSYNIYRSARYSRANQNELSQALHLLDQAQRLLAGGGYSRLPDFKCVARDNDNNRPFVLAFTDENFTVVKHREVKFGTLNECKTALNDAVALRDATANEYLALCNSRDGDSNRPWVMSTLDANNGTPIQTQSFSSYDDCKHSLHSPRNRNGNITFCTSRDGDNATPYIIGIFDPLSRSLSRANATFSTMNECRSFLQSY